MLILKTGDKVHQLKDLYNIYPDLKSVGSLSSYVGDSAPYRTWVFYTQKEELFIFWYDQGNDWGNVEALMYKYIVESIYGKDHVLLKAID